MEECYYIYLVSIDLDESRKDYHYDVGFQSIFLTAKKILMNIDSKFHF